MSTQYDPGNYNKSGMIAFIFSMIATLVFFIYVAFIHSGVDLKEIPKDEDMKASEMAVEAEAEAENAEAETEGAEAETEGAESESGDAEAEAE